MSKIKNGGLDQYGKVYSLNGVGGERVKDSNLCMEMHLWRRSCLSTGMLWKGKNVVNCDRHQLDVTT